MASGQYGTEKGAGWLQPPFSKRAHAAHAPAAPMHHHSGSRSAPALAAIRQPHAFKTAAKVVVVVMPGVHRTDAKLPAGRQDQHLKTIIPRRIPLRMPSGTSLGRAHGPISHMPRNPLTWRRRKSRCLPLGSPPARPCCHSLPRRCSRLPPSEGAGCAQRRETAPAAGVPPAAAPRPPCLEPHTPCGSSATQWWFP